MNEFNKLKKNTRDKLLSLITKYSSFYHERFLSLYNRVNNKIENCSTEEELIKEEKKSVREIFEFLLKNFTHKKTFAYHYDDYLVPASKKTRGKFLQETKE